MQPAINVGDLVVVHSSAKITAPTPGTPPKYKVGDVVAFSGQKDANTIITHRIANVKTEEGKILYETKGDANNVPDANLVAENKILGKNTFKIPALGKVFALAKTRTGFLALVVAPALLVILFEAYSIVRETIKIRRKSTNLDAPVQNPWPNNPNKILIKILLPFVIGVMFFQGSFSSYADVETANGNFLEAAASFSAVASPGPSPSSLPSSGSIVINEIYYRVDLSHRFGSESESEWAELYNPTSSSVNLTGWSIEDNTSCDNIPGSPIIPAGGFAIVTTTDETTFRSVWPAVPSDVIFITSPSAIGNGLANNDELMLRNSVCGSGFIVDHVSWGSNTAGLNPSVTSVPSDGISIERSPHGTDTNTNADFVQSSPPTPGS